MTGITKNVSRFASYITTPQPAPGVTGWAWEIIARADIATDDQGVIGVVFQQTTPAEHIYTKLIDNATWQKFTDVYNAETIQTLIWLTDLARSALDAGIFTSPAPANLIYTLPYQVNYPDPQTALQRLWDNKVNFFRARGEKATAHGGDLPHMDTPTASQIVIQQLRNSYRELAERTVNPRRRADDLFSFQPQFLDAKHVASVASATSPNPFDNQESIIDMAKDLFDARNQHQRAAIGILTQHIAILPASEREVYISMLDRARERLQQMGIEPIESDSPTELADKLAKFLQD